jgi:Cu2+-exporting ATPase
VRWQKDKLQPAILRAERDRLRRLAVRHRAPRRTAAQGRRTLGRQLFVAGLSMMQVMMYVAPAYLADDGTLDASMASADALGQPAADAARHLLLRAAVLRGAWTSLRARALGMDVPVALGIAAAFGAAPPPPVRGSGEVWFDSVTMFIFLLLAAAIWNCVARRKAGGRAGPAAARAARFGQPAGRTIPPFDAV